MATVVIITTEVDELLSAQSFSHQDIDLMSSGNVVRVGLLELMVVLVSVVFVLFFGVWFFWGESGFLHCFPNDYTNL